MANINDLPLEVLRMVIEVLYHQVALKRAPAFHAASCVARKWSDIAYDISFSRFYRFSHAPGSTIPTIKTATKLRALGNSEGLRRAAVAEKLEAQRKRLREEYHRLEVIRKRRQPFAFRTARRARSSLVGLTIKIEDEE